jgi:hypothetical protein
MAIRGHSQRQTGPDGAPRTYKRVVRRPPASIRCAKYGVADKLTVDPRRKQVNPRSCHRVSAVGMVLLCPTSDS